MATFSLAINALRAKLGARQFGDAVKKVRGEAAKTEKTMRSLKGILFGTFAGLGVVLAIRKLTSAVAEQESTLAQLRAGLESTNGVSGQTIASLTAMSKEMQRLTKFSNEAVEAAQGILLSFTQISGDVFPRTIRAAADVATRMGTDLKSATIQLGKALNDPIQNLSALSRSGIQFTQVQKEMIKALVLGGRMAEAQGIILEELERQYEGSAEAARDTLGGALAALRNEFDDVFKTVGKEGLGGAMRELTEFFISFFNLLNNNKNQMSDGFRTFAEHLIFIQKTWAEAFVAFKTIFKVLGTLAKNAGVAIFKGVAWAIRNLTVGFMGFAALVTKIWEKIHTGATFVVKKVNDLWKWVINNIKGGLVGMATTALHAFEEVLRASMESAAGFRLTAGAIDKMREALFKVQALRLGLDIEPSKGFDDFVKGMEKQGEDIKKAHDAIISSAEKVEEALTPDVEFTMSEDIEKAAKSANKELEEINFLYRERKKVLNEIKGATTELSEAQKIEQKAASDLAKAGAKAEADRLSALKRTQKMYQQLGSTVGRAFEDMIFEAKTLSDAMKDLLKDIAKVLFRRFVTEKIAGGIAGGLAGAKHGMVALASGGVVAAPTMAMIGESGAEAVMPLKRGSDGKLGVEAAGAGQPTSTINNTFNVQAVDQKSFMDRMTDPRLIRAQAGAAAVNNQRRKGF